MKTQSPPGAPTGAPGSATAPSPNSSEANANDTAAKAFAEAMARLLEIREYVSFYLATRADALRLTLRSAVLYAALGVIGLLAAGAAVVVAVTLLLSGAARGLGGALGGHLWLGDLIVGLVVLAFIGIVARMAISKVFGISRTQTVEKYESRKRDQRVRFGHDVNRNPQRHAR